MALMMRGLLPDNVDAVWVECGPIRVELRPILPTKDEEIDLSIPAGVVKVNHKEGTEERDPDKWLKRQNALFLAKGRFALKDTDGFEVFAGDAEWAAFLSKVTHRVVSVGDTVSLDGCWSDEVKQRVLATIENEGSTCAFPVEVERDGVKVQETVMLPFNVWIVRTAQKLGRDSAARAASLKS